MTNTIFSFLCENPLVKGPYKILECNIYKALGNRKVNEIQLVGEVNIYFILKFNFPSCSTYPQSWVNSAMCLTSCDPDMPSFAGVNITVPRLGALAKLACPTSAGFTVLFCSLLLICFQPFLSLLFTSSKNFPFSLSPPLWPSYCLMSLSSTSENILVIN